MHILQKSEGGSSVQSLIGSVVSISHCRLYLSLCRSVSFLPIARFSAGFAERCSLIITSLLFLFRGIFVSKACVAYTTRTNTQGLVNLPTALCFLLSERCQFLRYLRGNTSPASPLLPAWPPPNCTVSPSAAGRGPAGPRPPGCSPDRCCRLETPPTLPVHRHCPHPESRAAFPHRPRAKTNPGPRAASAACCQPQPLPLTDLPPAAPPPQLVLVSAGPE